MKEPSGFRAVRKTVSLSDQVTDELRGMVTSGDLEIGELLPSESTLAKQLGVSRTVVREAVSRLKVDGLLSSQQGRGVFVVSTRPVRGFSIRGHDAQSIEHVLRMVELRMGFEVEAAAFAAARRTRQDLTVMSMAHESFREAVASGDIQAGVDADMAFHRAVCTATDNELYLEFFNYLSSYLKETILVSRRKAVTRVDGGQAPIAEHQTLIDAIVAQDVDAARIAARYHIECNMHRLQTYYGVMNQ